MTPRPPERDTDPGAGGCADRLLACAAARRGRLGGPKGLLSPSVSRHRRTMTEDPNDTAPRTKAQPAEEPLRRTVLVGAAAALAPVAVAGPPSLSEHPLWNKPAPPLVGVTVQGARIDIARLRGKVVVIEFWGVWCPDCRNDAPHAAALARALAARPDTVFLTVHRRERFNRWPTLQAYFDEMQINFPTLLDADETISNTWQVKWVPSYYVLDRKLRVAHMRTDLGPLGGDALLAIVDRLRKARD